MGLPSLPVAVLEQDRRFVFWNEARSGYLESSPKHSQKVPRKFRFHLEGRSVLKVCDNVS